MEDPNGNEMHVIKRNGSTEPVEFDKILNRVKKIASELQLKVNCSGLVMKVIDQLFDGITATKIDELTAEQCASMSSIHPDYNTVAGQVIISNHQKNTKSSFVDVMNDLYNFTDIHGNHSPLLAADFIETVNILSEELDAMCSYDRDFLIDYFWN